MRKRRLQQQIEIHHFVDWETSRRQLLLYRATAREQSSCRLWRQAVNWKAFWSWASSDPLGPETALLRCSAGPHPSTVSQATGASLYPRQDSPEEQLLSLWLLNKCVCIPFPGAHSNNILPPRLPWEKILTYNTTSIFTIHQNDSTKGLYRPEYIVQLSKSECWADGLPSGYNRKIPFHWSYHDQIAILEIHWFWFWFWHIWLKKKITHTTAWYVAGKRGSFFQDRLCH